METVSEDLDLADAHVIATCAATHRPNGAAPTTIDYLIVSGTFKEYVQDVSVDLAYGCSPHVAVRLSASAQPRRNRSKWSRV